MPPALRYLHKLTGPLITSKHLGLFSQKCLISQIVQYSNNVHLQGRIADSPFPDNDIKLKESYLYDNREVSSDIVTKTHVGRLVTSERLCSTNKHEEILLTSKPQGTEGRLPPEKLLHVYQVLSESLPKIFVQPMDYSVYSKNIVFEDNIRNIRTEGLINYVKQVALLRTVAHIKFAYVKFDVLKITQHPEDGTVRIRWRIVGVSGLKVMVQFWKYKLWKMKETIQQNEAWHDGFSTFYVNAEGKIVRHVADKMMPDSDSVTEERSTDLNSAKLALMVSVIPRFSEIGLFT
ncbi:uncharacterized protein C6orf136 homolog [Euwallacea similis]|uniref:uncharacterized protein C6orf136 homolog n=1 Tax=Euwallacea similis TaxID=1736056 RepID=UPI00345046E8